MKKIRTISIEDLPDLQYIPAKYPELEKIPFGKGYFDVINTRLEALAKDIARQIVDKGVTTIEELKQRLTVVSFHEDSDKRFNDKIFSILVDGECIFTGYEGFSKNNPNHVNPQLLQIEKALQNEFNQIKKSELLGKDGIMDNGGTARI